MAKIVKATGIYYEPARKRYRVLVNVDGQQERAFFPAGSGLTDMRDWQTKTRARLVAAAAAVDQSEAAELKRSGIVRRPLTEDIAIYLTEHFAGATDDTIEQHATTLAMWAEQFRNRCRHDVTRAQAIEAYRTVRADRGFVDSTMNAYRARLVTFYEYMNERDQVVGAENPARKMPYHNIQRKARAANWQQVLDTLAALPRDTAARRLCADRLTLLAWTGMRPIELSLIERGDFRDGKAPQLFVSTVKGGDKRVLPLHPAAAAAVRGIFAAPGGIGRVTFDYEGELWRDTWSRLFPDSRRPRPYDLRHTYGTICQLTTGDITATATQLGHKQLKTTMIYVEAAMKPALLAAHDRIAAALAEPGKGILRGLGNTASE